jgi:hypothetical protein
MKVRIVLTVEVDVAAYAHEYGLATEEVREDVKTYVNQAVGECPAAQAGLLRLL